jgi:hypothetical protein
MERVHLCAVRVALALRGDAAVASGGGARAPGGSDVERKA